MIPQDASQDFNAPPNTLFYAVRQLVAESRIRVASAINSELVLLYWSIGDHIQKNILQFERAEYGKQVIATLSRQLTSEFGPGWSEKHLRHCLRASEVFPNKNIVSTLCRELSWSHIRLFVYMDDPVKRKFYMEICRIEKWSFRVLRERINSMLFERTALSKLPEETILNDIETLQKSGDITPDLVFRDPYLLDFLGLPTRYSEKDLESAIVSELQQFISELGQDFAFLARQKRIMIDNRDYYIDLLFYHRRLKCLVAIDLKLGEFEAGFKGQMELYLRYLKKNEMVSGENTPIGLILCSGKNDEHVELMQLQDSNIRIADYLTQLPSKEFLQAKLHKAITIARQRIELEKGRSEQ